MEISAINQGVHAIAATPAATPMEQASENRDIVRAVKALNGSEMLGPENQLMFQRDQTSQRMIVRVVNRKTNEVVSQIPPEYVLRLAEGLKPKHS